MTTNGSQRHAQATACNFNDRISPTCQAARHGTAAAYRRGCRCDIARHQIAVYQQQRLLDAMHGQSRMLSNVGALRRLHALRALGYTTRQLAACLGIDERNISRWPTRTRISRRHYNAICHVYDELADTRGPDERARRHAARQGWLPPMWWDDDTIDDPSHNPLTVEPKAPRSGRPGHPPLHLQHDIDPVVVERLVKGEEEPGANTSELYAAYRELRRRGASTNALEQQLRLSSAARKFFAAAYRQANEEAVAC